MLTSVAEPPGAPLARPRLSDGSGIPALRLLGSRPFRSGVVLLRYAPR